MYCGKFKNFLQREFLDRRLLGCNGSILGWRLTQTPYKLNSRITAPYQSLLIRVIRAIRG